MKRHIRKSIAVASMLLFMSCGKESAKEIKVKETNNTNNPEYIGGYPTDETVEKAFHQLNVNRVAQVYYELYSVVSQNAFINSMINDFKLTKPGDIGVYDQLGKGRESTVGLTYNTESIYSTTYADLKIDGPTVVEIPPRVLGILNDTWMRYIADLGIAGPDKGAGGKYLLLPPEYEGEVPEGYFVYKSPSYKVWVMTRAFIEDSGTDEEAVEYYKKYVKVYPLNSGERADAKCISISNIPATSIPSKDISFFNVLNSVVQYEPRSIFTPYEAGLLKSIGIEKGQEFKLNTEWKNIYEEGLKLGQSYIAANAFNYRGEESNVYSDRNYEYIFIGGSHEFKDENGAYLLDARALFHYTAIVITPAMTVKKAGAGSIYMATYKDNHETYLMGENTYVMHLPKDIPAENFWSATVYDADTRSIIQNGVEKQSVSGYDKPEINQDGSYDIYFSPEKPKNAKNWVKTIPGKGWFTYIRIYGPQQAFFDQNWKPDNIKIVK